MGRELEIEKKRGFLDMIELCRYRTYSVSPSGSILGDTHWKSMAVLLWSPSFGVCSVCLAVSFCSDFIIQFSDGIEKHGLWIDL